MPLAVLKPLIRNWYELVGNNVCVCVCVCVCMCVCVRERERVCLCSLNQHSLSREDVPGEALITPQQRERGRERKIGSESMNREENMRRKMCEREKKIPE